MKTPQAARSRLSPKLRVIRKSGAQVNAARAENAGNVVLVEDSSLQELEAVCGQNARPQTWDDVRDVFEFEPTDEPTDEVLVNVFVGTSRDPGPFDSGQKDGKWSAEKIEAARKARTSGNLTIEQVRLSELDAITARDGVTEIEIGEPLSVPSVELSDTDPSAPSVAVRRFGNARRLRDEHEFGAGVLIGIIDVGGFDFAHEDFLDDDGNTRFVSIWDQGGDLHDPPEPFSYGSETSKADMDAAIAAAATIGLPATELEPQSQMSEESHGTHVASIAAGNRGVCRDAMIAGVLVDLPPEDLDRRLSFFDSTRIADAIAYLLAVADTLSKERGEHVPVSINISLGTNGHAHDGSSAVSRWIDSALTVPGRAVCAAAGNAGQELPESDGDIGFIFGRIHTSGRIPSTGLEDDIHWQVVGNGIVDLSENELEIWYSPQDEFAVSVRPPGGDFIGPVEVGEFIENRQLDDGSFLSVFNERYVPANGDNRIAIFLTPLLSQAGIVGVPGGQWTVRLHGRQVRDGRYDGWIERDDARRLGTLGPRQAWRFPSFFSAQSNIDDSQISSLACGANVTAVANLDAATERINISSSAGPTRDGRSKPEIAAPGTNIVAASGFTGDDQKWIAQTGTSMASPFVAGVIGLMLGAQPDLTASQINGILKRTARPLPGGDFTWDQDAGFGQIVPEDCLREALKVAEPKEVTG